MMNNRDSVPAIYPITTYQWATGFALVPALLLLWINGAVGLIGSDDDPANLMYVGVIAVGLFGAAIARFRAGGMARALLATAAAHASVAAIALIGNLGYPYTSARQIINVNGFFVMLWLASALLFWHAARERPPELTRR